MFAVHAALNNLLKNELTLSDSQVTQASKSHNYVRDLLINRSSFDGEFPRLVQGDFLSGSYARGTKIYPLDDVDVMMVIDGGGLNAIHNGQVLDAAVRGDEEDNPIQQHFGQDRLLNSNKILSLFKGVLSGSHPNSKISKDQQAVNVWLETHGMGIDIVPCFHIQPRNGTQDFYFIPMGGGRPGWLMTNPKIDKNISDILHEKYQKKFKGLVRLVKYWNRVFNGSALRSYHLETLVWHVFKDYQGDIEPYDHALMYFFEKVIPLLRLPCPDLTQLGETVDSYITYDSRQKSMDNAKMSLFILHLAYSTNPTDEDKKLKAWQKILGEKFVF